MSAEPLCECVEIISAASARRIGAASVLVVSVRRDRRDALVHPRLLLMVRRNSEEAQAILLEIPDAD